MGVEWESHSQWSPAGAPTVKCCVFCENPVLPVFRAQVPSAPSSLAFETASSKMNAKAFCFKYLHRLKYYNSCNILEFGI